ncbi:MAG: hypothetical protein FJ137_10565 [Deltaproteobacteria bacterium]|nr:hypothetical protein [Deltaproteobacteria bacterium]
MTVEPAPSPTAGAPATFGNVAAVATPCPPLTAATLDRWRAALPDASWASFAAAPTASATPTLLPPWILLQHGLDRAVEPLLAPDSGVDLMRVALLELDVAAHVAVALGDAPQARVTAKTCGAHPLGTTVTVGFSVGVGERIVLDGSLTFLARAPRRRIEPDVAAAARADDDARFAALPPCFDDVRALDARAPAAFARALGVHDAVNDDDDVARMASLPAAVVPWAGGVAIVWSALLAHAGRGPRAVRRLRVRPAQPLLGGDSLALSVRGPDAAGVVAVRLSVVDAPADKPAGLVAFAELA